MQGFGEWVLVFMLAASALGIGPGKAVPANTSTAPEAVTLPEAVALPEAVTLPEAVGLPEIEPSTLQASTLQLTGPTACPLDGCTGGQRIGMRYEFDLGSTTYDPVTDPTSEANVMVCLYASESWNINYLTVASDGELSGKPYFVPGSQDCAPLTGFKFLAERITALDTGTPGDALRFAFRLGFDGAGSGRAMARLLVRTGGVWTPITTAFTSSPILTMIPLVTAYPVYVANDSTACGAYSPCYINSYGDEGAGLGTGLKDAVDAAAAGTFIYVIGNYSIKTSAVEVNKNLTITGVNDAAISYTGLNNAASCDEAMLVLKNIVTIRGLNIDDGNCTSKNRTLIEVNSRPAGSPGGDIVFIESNDLSSGDNAIVIRDSYTDKLVVRYNQISGNSGHAIYFQGAGASAMEAVANNITSNQVSPPIRCAEDAGAPISNRVANHNYWGTSAPSQEDTRCAIVSAKRLGAPIAHNSSVPGVHAALMSVTTTKSYASGFDNQIAFYRSGSGATDFNMYIVDHGYMTSSGPPFTGAQGGESPSPCSNYWDVFLANSEPVSDTLQLFFKYFNKDGKTPGCLAVINSSQYCEQTTTPGKYPLFWFDPSGDNITKWWDFVGAPPEDEPSLNGQTTTCNIADNEIQVSIDGNGRPNLNDMGYIPFMVGIPVIKSFDLNASSQTVQVKWATNNEPDISGFYVLRGTESGSLTPINGDLIQRIGSASAGSTYNLTDSERTNTVKYFYRLQVVRTDGYSFYSEIKNVTVNAATATSIPPTRTATPIVPTRTPTLTRVPTSRPTLIPTRTFTPSTARTPTATRMVLPTLTSTLNIQTPGVVETQNAMSTRMATLATATGSIPLPPDEGTTPGGDLTVTPGSDLTLTPGGNLTVTPSKPPATAIALVGTQTPQPSSSPTQTETASGTAAASSTHPWTSLLLGLLAGLALVGGAGSWWYFTTRK